MQKLILFWATCLLALASCTSDKQYVVSEYDIELDRAINEHGGRDEFILPASNDYGAIPSDPNNPLSLEKVELGKLLFFETGLALAPMRPIGKGTYSCATCHVPTAGFRPGVPQGIADGGLGFGDNGEGRVMNTNYTVIEPDVQGLRPLSVLNAAFVQNTTWNGRFGAGFLNEGTEDRWNVEDGSEINHLGLRGLEGQNIEGLHVHRMVINKDVLDTLGYTAMFDEAFADLSEDERYSPLAASFALSAYLRALVTDQAPFQLWLKGDNTAMTNDQKRGANLFFGKANCSACHRGHSLNGNNFYAIGVDDLYKTGAINTSQADPRNLGRGDFTGLAEDMYKFKVPQLYNLGDAPFYFHGASKETLADVVEYFNDATPENFDVPVTQISEAFQPLNLTNLEKELLVEFLENGLRDPNLDRYVPASLPSGNCFPNNDFISQQDLGCE